MALDGWMDGWMEGWMEGGRDGWVVEPGFGLLTAYSNQKDQKLS